MRLFEQVHVALGNASRVLDARPGGSADTLRLPAGVAHTDLRPESASPGCSGPGDLLIAVAPRGMSGPQAASALDTVLAALAAGGRALLLVPAAPENLPVSAIVDGLSRHGCQVTAALPGETAAGYTGLVIQRADDVLTIGTYLVGTAAEGGVGHGGPADVAYLRRALNELVLTGFAARRWSTRWREVEEDRARLADEVTRTSSELARVSSELARVSSDLQEAAAHASERERALLVEAAQLRDELRRLRSSSSFQAARALADGVRHPLSKGPQLPRVAYRLALTHRRRNRTTDDGTPAARVAPSRR